VDAYSIGALRSMQDVRAGAGSSVKPTWRQKLAEADGSLVAVSDREVHSGGTLVTKTRNQRP
jgi:hypothetical protein